jgi:cellulose synthase/poly-beta-1,6-N-acetylglucosamine synthase-like glycosyltransferase
MDLTMPSFESLLLVLYYVTLGTLALYGVHRALLLVEWWRSRDRGRPLPAPPERWPRVTVQLPLFNERFVAERLLAAAARLDYPRDRLEIQVLDDSTDETSQIVARRVAALATSGLDIRCLHRNERIGYKAGALAAGMAVATGELLCVFDADFEPLPDFLRRTVPHFAAPEIGMVQARWSHRNRDRSLLTRVQAILLDGHFVVEQTARHRSGCFFNFNGTAGVWRRAAIEDAGGWSADTLTEDLDLSYRAQLAGWSFLYLPDLTVPSELPADVNAFKGQQHRWSRGSVQTARKLVPRVLRARLSRRVRAEALVHLTNNLSYPLMILLSLLVFPAMVLRQGDAPWRLLAVDLPLFLAATVSVSLFYAAGQAAIGRPRRETLRRLPLVLAVGIGLAVHNTGAVLGGLVVDGGVFHRTPKTGEEPVCGGGAYRLSRKLSLYGEGLMTLYLLVCTGLAVAWEMWRSLPFLVLFLQGYLTMVLLGVARERRGGVALATSRPVASVFPGPSTSET